MAHESFPMNVLQIAQYAHLAVLVNGTTICPLIQIRHFNTIFKSTLFLIVQLELKSHLYFRNIYEGDVFNSPDFFILCSYY